VLRNATLFDGESFLSKPVDIVFDKGLIISVTETGADKKAWGGRAVEYDLHGQFVTPGLVDMHSHHLIERWPLLKAGDDGNEVHPDFGPLTPFLRALDSLKPYDQATVAIASGGITSSLIIPGSANIMGGEGTVVKNRLRPGRNREYFVEELLLEHGIPFEDRRRYMKMACGENPKRVYGHTRMGNAWVLRKHFARAKDLLEKQDAWCAAAERLVATGAGEEATHKFVEHMGGGLPTDLELDSTVGMLRGRVNMHNHCYEPEDFETMLRVTREFGVKIRAFHHALSAWLVPEMIKELGQNITIATFAEFSLYKVEAYQSSLWAGKILNDHGLPVAYKSDHSDDGLDAKYLLSQASIAHHFHLPADKALQSVTSIPAKAIDQADRVGYARPGYDADLVVWDSHPLSVGATPRQVFIDGFATLDPVRVKQSMDYHMTSRVMSGKAPAMRAVVTDEKREQFCAKAEKLGKTLVVTGIRRSFLENYPELSHAMTGNGDSEEDFTLVVANHTITCLDLAARCAAAASVSAEDDTVRMHLSAGILTPGLTAVSGELGIREIMAEEVTGDGTVPVLTAGLPIPRAARGIFLDGKGFVRARLGGVTRAVTAPLPPYGGVLRGVSAGILTSSKRGLLDGGVFRDDVAVHVQLGDSAKVSPGSGSMGVQLLRRMLGLDDGEEDTKIKAAGSVYALVKRAKMPLVVHAKSLVCILVVYQSWGLSLMDHWYTD
jgi:imidazolonepropionase-like amidohydrolase